MLNTKEQVLYYFLYHDIRLNVYDKKFLLNLENIIKNQKKVTTNQKKLFEKLILKYTKQFFKKGFDSASLVQLPWKTPIVESDAHYTNAQVSAEQGKLILRTPFNRNFISWLRSGTVDVFNWTREKKCYISDLNSYSLKFLYHNLPKFFTEIKYDETTQSILNELNSYSADIWDPTLVKVHDYYIIGAVNKFVDEATKNIKLNDRAKTLFDLSLHGVKAHDRILKNSLKKKFAVNPRPSIDIKHVDSIAKWLREFGIQNVYFNKDISSVVALGELLDLKNVKSSDTIQIEKALAKYKIIRIKNEKFFSSDNSKGLCVIIKTFSAIKPSYYKNTKPVCKYITVLNSQEINIK